MTRTIDTSLTLFDTSAAAPIDVHTFADPGRYFPIQSTAVAGALEAIAREEAKRKTVRVGGGGTDIAVDFFVLDVKRDKVLSRRLSRMLHDAFLDATAGALKSVMDGEGFLDARATGKLDAVEQVIELRRFIANARVRRGRGEELLFHQALPEAAE